jgi:Uma2 family endonuclease
MEGPPDLAVEVVSPSSIEIDREDKFAQYRSAGVSHYWIVDPELKTIDAWKLRRRQYVRVGHGQGTAIVKLPPFPELEIPMGRLWRKTAR